MLAQAAERNRELAARLYGRFDVSIDVQGLLKSAIAARLSGARLRIGLARPAGRELSHWLNNHLVLPTATHIVDRNLELLAPLGIRPVSGRFGLAERAEDTMTAAQILNQQFAGRAPAIVNPGAGWPSKLWPAERFAGVARHLHEVRGVPTLVVWAGADEQTLAQQIVAQAGGGAQLAPATTLCQLAALARRARLFVSSDTGPLHLAAAVGTPCVGLFGPMPAERNGPYGPGHIALQEVCLTGSRPRAPSGQQRLDAGHLGRARHRGLRQDSRPGRPPLRIVAHPIFWQRSRHLAFRQQHNGC